MLLRLQPPMRRNPKQERAAFTLEAVLQAAQKLLAERGPDGLKMTEVAKLAGVGVGTLYQYFPDRGALLATLAEQVCMAWLETLQETLAQAAGQPVEARLRRLSEVASIATAEHRALKAAVHPELFKLASDGTLVDSTDDFARGMLPALDGLGLPADAAMTTARLMVSAGDAMIDCAIRVEPPLPVPVLAGQLFAVWHGLVQEAQRAHPSQGRAVPA